MSSAHSEMIAQLQSNVRALDIGLDGALAGLAEDPAER
jgi:hypothetical protein